MERGIIVPTGIIQGNVENGKIAILRSYTPQELQYFVLYWDHIALPKIQNFSLGIPHIEDYIAAGAIVRPSVMASQKNNFAEGIMDAYGQVASQLVQQSSIDWSVMQLGNTSIFTPQYTAAKRNIRVTLEKVLPIPKNEVAIHDLLEFKQYRSTELHALHESLDEVYESIITSGDPDLKHKKELSRLKKAILDLDRTMLERFKIIRKRDISTKLEITPNSIAEFVASGIFDFATTQTPLYTGFTAAKSFIKVGMEYSFTFSPAAGNLKLGYLSKAKSERIL